MSLIIKYLLAGSRRYTASRASLAEKITRTLGDGISEVLPSDRFEVRVRSKVITIAGKEDLSGNSITLATAAIWLLPLPESRRITMIFEGYAKAVQDFVSRTQKEPWPAPDADTRMEIVNNAIHVWWGSDSDKDHAVLRMKPISFAEFSI
jgi:hypothetical protein